MFITGVLIDKRKRVYTNLDGPEISFCWCYYLRFEKRWWVVTKRNYRLFGSLPIYNDVARNGLLLRIKVIVLYLVTQLLIDSVYQHKKIDV